MFGLDDYKIFCRELFLEKERRRVRRGIFLRIPVSGLAGPAPTSGAGPGRGGAGWGGDRSSPSRVGTPTRRVRAWTLAVTSLFETSSHQRFTVPRAAARCEVHSGGDRGGAKGTLQPGAPGAGLPSPPRGPRGSRGSLKTRPSPGECEGQGEPHSGLRLRSWAGHLDDPWIQVGFPREEGPWGPGTIWPLLSAHGGRRGRLAAFL
ncbi:hypothetical protein HJG60_008957 [Phyllostomus discolor]|uniref:Uncharacterized protein n=1 Tax=Phyllostomus discolor TaxID=89673 RepID=A0A833YWV3_9CHIR|nr:hypothetical protein HJG60_008957 [Phyllostomus discolor]